MAPVPTGKDVLVVGKTYVISKYGTNKVFTVVNPTEVRLRDWDTNNTYQRFECTKTDQNWLGLKSVATGMYLGRERNGDVLCSAKSQTESESFVLRQAQEGGNAMFVQLEGQFYRTFEVSAAGGSSLMTDIGATALVVGFTMVYDA